MRFTIFVCQYKTVTFRTSPAFKFILHKYFTNLIATLDGVSPLKSVGFMAPNHEIIKLNKSADHNLQSSRSRGSKFVQKLPPRALTAPPDMQPSIIQMNHPNNEPPKLSFPKTTRLFFLGIYLCSKRILVKI